MSSCKAPAQTTCPEKCSENTCGLSTGLFIIVLYILLAIILGAVFCY